MKKPKNMNANTEPLDIKITKSFTDISNLEPIILTLNNKIIGQLGIIPTKIKFEDSFKSATWYIDFAV